MNKTLRYSLMSLFMLVCGSMFADSVVTFEAANDHTSAETVLTLTKEGVSITIEAGTSTSGAGKLHRNDNYRFYRGNNVTISSTVGNISKIVFTCTATGSAKKYGPNCFKAQEGYSYTADSNEGVWVGSAAKVDFTAENGQVQATKIVVTIGESGGPTKKSAGLKFSAETVNHELGTTFVSPTFEKATTAAVTFSSDNEEVATVDAQGTISITGKEGAAVITAKAEANDEYEAGSATCKVYVNKFNTYKKVTTVEPGKKYLMVAQRDGKTIYGMSIQEKYTYGRLSGKELDGTLDIIKISNYYDNALTIEKMDGGYSLKDYCGRYFWLDDDHDSFQLDKDNAHAWTIEPAANGTFTIANNGKYIQYGPQSYTTFSGYDTEQENAVLPMLYVLDEVASGINNVNSSMKNLNEIRYNVAGQRVANNYKGIVIVNGKKMLVK